MLKAEWSFFTLHKIMINVWKSRPINSINCFAFQDKTYENEAEESLRKKIFVDNLNEIVSHNHLFSKGLTSFELGINPFSDMVRHYSTFSRPTVYCVVPSYLCHYWYSWNNLCIYKSTIPLCTESCIASVEAPKIMLQPLFYFVKSWNQK